jgi:PAS domain S-box-containing protein
LKIKGKTFKKAKKRRVEKIGNNPVLSGGNFMEIISRSENAVIILSESGVIEYINFKAALLSGKKRSALTGTYEFGKFIDEKHKDWLKEYLRAVKNKKAPFSGETKKFTLKNKTERIILWKTSFMDSRGTVSRKIYFEGIDITQTVNAKKLIDEYSATLDTASSAIASIDAAGIIVGYNRAAAKIFGTNRKALLNTEFKRLMLNEEYETAMKRLHDVAVKGHSYGGEYRMIKKNGEKIYVSVSSTAVLDNDGKFIRTISVLEDITEMKKAGEKMKQQAAERALAEQKIEESEKFYRELFNSNNDAIVIMEMTLENQKIPKVKVTDLNEMTCGIFELTRAELMKKKVSDFIGNPWLDRIRDDMWALKPGDTSSNTVEITTGKGKKLTCEVRIKTFTVGEKNMLLCVVRDITGRLENERALKDSEELYRTLINTSNDGVMLSNTRGTITFASAMAASMHGYKDASSLTGKSLADLTDTESKSMLINEIAGLVKKGGAAMAEYTALRRDGTRFTAEIYFSMIKDSYGRPASIMSTIRDITDRKNAEYDLKESEKKYRSVISSTGQLVYEYILSSGIIIWGGAVEQITGFTQEEFNEEVSIDIWEEMIHPDDRSNAVESLVKARQECGKYSAKYRFRTKSGGYIYVEDEGMFLPDESGEAYKMLGVMKDISARIKYENEIMESEEKFRSLSEQSLLGLAILQDGMVKYLNDAFARINGYSRQEIIGWTYEDFYSHVEPVDAEMMKKGSDERKMKSGDQQKNYQFRLKSGSGRIKWIDVYVRTIIYGGRPADFITQADITNLKETEEKLNRTINELKNSNTELEQFAYVASHDLQEPLRMVSSYVQLIKKRYEGRLGTDADDFIRFAVDGADRMQHLIRDLLAYSRVGISKKEPGPVAMENVVRTAMSNMEMLLKETGATVSFSGLPVINADELQMVQLAQNLMSNSIKFRKKETPPVLQISAERRPGEWVFKFSDNGIGIDGRYYDKIFIIFQRLHGKSEYPGTGIGLAICKKIVESYGGFIRVDSTEGEGTSFYFSVPDGKK